jgi:hypothetical protein
VHAASSSRASVPLREGMAIIASAAANCTPVWMKRSFAKSAQDFGCGLPLRSRPQVRLKLSPAGPMVLHAPSVWERRSLPALIKASLRNQIGLFLFGSRIVAEGAVHGPRAVRDSERPRGQEIKVFLRDTPRRVR